MLWIITEDKISEPDERSHIGTCRLPEGLRAVLAVTPAPNRPALKAKWAAELCNFDFRLLDDDGGVYYVGVCKDLDDQDGDSAFEPLDWAVGAGCTEMQYRKKGAGDWQTL